MVKLLLVSSLLLGLIGPPAVGVDPLERALLVLETLDATELSVRYRDEPLESVMHDLNERLGPKQILLRQSLRVAGRIHSGDRRISVRL